ncbi:unnamed protein product [Periconia digitata]|uniref:Uncharacterized protein n=1 Tax=Periconia digitata TaxID=1303443 RepID=A0A9W4TZ65_9PLEO|nr:unnamed protein product [Periconia digitata]
MSTLVLCIQPTIILNRNLRLHPVLIHSERAVLPYQMPLLLVVRRGLARNDRLPGYLPFNDRPANSLQYNEGGSCVSWFRNRIATIFSPSVVQKLSEFGVRWFSPILTFCKVMIWMTVFRIAASISSKGYVFCHVVLSPYCVRFVMYSAAACSESVAPNMLQYASNESRSVNSLRTALKPVMAPLCIQMCRPNTNG